MTVIIRNNDTGHTERRILAPDEWAILYGPGLEHLETRVTPLIGTITITLRPKREARWRSQ